MIERAGFGGYYWVADQIEVATDVAFADRPALEKIMPDLLAHATHVNRYFLQLPFMTAPGLTAADVAAKAERELAALVTPHDPGSPQ